MWAQPPPQVVPPPNYYYYSAPTQMTAQPAQIWNFAPPQFVPMPSPICQWQPCPQQQQQGWPNCAQLQTKQCQWIPPSTFHSQQFPQQPQVQHPNCAQLQQSQQIPPTMPPNPNPPMVQQHAFHSHHSQIAMHNQIQIPPYQQQQQCAQQLQQQPVPCTITMNGYLYSRIQQNSLSAQPNPVAPMVQNAYQPQIAQNYAQNPVPNNPLYRPQQQPQPQVAPVQSAATVSGCSYPRIQQNPSSAQHPVHPKGQAASQPQIAPNYAQNPVPSNPLYRPQQQQCSQPIPSANPRKFRTAQRQRVNLRRQNLNNNLHYCGPMKFEQLNITPSATQILLDWEVPDLRNPTTGKYKIHLVVTEQFEGRKRKRHQLDADPILDEFHCIHVRQSQFDTTPGSSYAIELSVVNPETNEIVVRESQKAKAAFYSDEMHELLDKAIAFAGTEMHPFTHLYRCKPQCYWDIVEETKTMEVYVKDNNGQAASPINQKIEGLFFMASVTEQGILPDFSPFGNVRMALPAENLLDPYQLNFYFSDFYCYYKPSKLKHYVQIVATVKNSEADSFCCQKLPWLDPFDNPFLRFSHTPQMNTVFFVNKHEDVWVEILYTENVEMRDEYWFDTVRSRGEDGEGLTDETHHNRRCRHCNLYPIGPIPIPTHSNQLHEQSSGFWEADTFEESTEAKENVDFFHQPNARRRMECPLLQN